MIGLSDADFEEERYNTPIETLDLGVRSYNALKRVGITTIGEVLEMLDRGPDAMLAIRNFGEKWLDELVERLKEKAYLPPEREIGLNGGGQTGKERNSQLWAVSQASVTVPAPARGLA